MVAILGYPDRESLLSAGYIELFADVADWARFTDILERDGVVQEFEVHMIRYDDTAVWMQVDCQAVRDGEGQIVAHEGSCTDVTLRKEAEAQLVHEALHDGLTGLPNRAYLMERLSHAIEHAKRREDYRFAVLFLDFDRFKVINDSLGHTAGDQLLVAVAERLRTRLRQVDMVARLGGDEFALLLGDIQGLPDATFVASRIQASLSEPFMVQKQEVFVSASIGIALSDSGYDRAEDALRDADIAMYRAKALGRARYEVFDTTMHLQTLDSLQLEMDLRRALERRELRLYYQPIIHMETGEIASVEALVRWQHPVRGSCCRRTSSRWLRRPG